jgi:hypothetical protein
MANRLRLAMSGLAQQTSIHRPTQFNVYWDAGADHPCASAHPHQDSKGSMVYNFPEGTGIDPNASGIVYDPSVDSLLFPGGTISVKSAFDQITDKDSGTSLIGFNQSVSGSVARSAQAKLRETVSVKDFGAVGDGVADDADALEAAIAHAAANDLVLLFPEGHYFTTRRIGSESTLLADMNWICNNARITLSASVSHQSAVIVYRLSPGKNHSVTGTGLYINGNSNANVGFYVRQNNDDRTGTFYGANIHVVNIKRLNTFQFGDGIYIRGGYRDVTLYQCSVQNVELPAGQGTPLTIGVTGITVSRGNFSTEPGTFSLNTTLDSCYVDRVYSSDLTYLFDQDGCRLFADDPTPTLPLEPATVSVINCNFKDCRGRSIKTQVSSVTITDCKFDYTSFTDITFGGVLGIQQCLFAYINNCQFFTSTNADQVMVIGSTSSQTRPISYIVKNCLLQTLSGGSFGEVITFDLAAAAAAAASFSAVIDSIVCKGVISGLGRFRTPMLDRTKYVVKVSNCFVDEITRPALCRLAATVTNAEAILKFENCHNFGPVKGIVEDRISGQVARAAVSSIDTFGFNTVTSQSFGQTQQAGTLSINALTPYLPANATSGSFSLNRAGLNAGNQATFARPGLDSGLVFISSRSSTSSHNSQGSGLFIYSSQGIIPLAAGTEWAAGLLTEPSTGRYRVWIDSGDIVVKNVTGGNPVQFTLAFLG